MVQKRPENELNYLSCSNCGQIAVFDGSSEGEQPRFKCLECEAKETFQAWPSAAVRDLINFVSEYDKAAPQYGQVACVFSSCVLELLLEEVVWVMAVWETDYDTAEHLLDAVMDAYQGRSRLIALYKRFGYGSLSSEVNSLGRGDFMSNWEKIVSARNKVLHGKIQEGANITPDLIDTTIAQGLEVFRLLHNKYNQQTFQFKAATKAI
jgi:hypothetical protein